MRVWLFSSYKLESTRPCKDFYSKQQTMKTTTQKSCWRYTFLWDFSSKISTSLLNSVLHINPNIPNKQPRNSPELCSLDLPTPNIPKLSMAQSTPQTTRNSIAENRGGTWWRFSVSYRSGGGYVRTGRNNTHPYPKKLLPKWPLKNKGMVVIISSIFGWGWGYKSTNG